MISNDQTVYNVLNSLPDDNSELLKSGESPEKLLKSDIHEQQNNIGNIQFISAA